jgi:hypothetical protein
VVPARNNPVDFKMREFGDQDGRGLDKIVIITGNSECPEIVTATYIELFVDLRIK